MNFQTEAKEHMKARIIKKLAICPILEEGLNDFCLQFQV